jgi:aminomethyltransferase
VKSEIAIHFVLFTISKMGFDAYDHIRAGGAGFHEQKRGLIAVWGKEAVQFLDGMITNDVKTLADDSQMLAAFPNAQGRMLALVRVLRQGDRFLIETNEATREKVFQNLFRFTYAGDFFVEDLSDSYQYLEIFGSTDELPPGEDTITFRSNFSLDCCCRPVDANAVKAHLTAAGAVTIPEDVYETLRIENGVPKYGGDMDETTIVPELGLEGLISYTKGCYIGQEIIARIHFRGHVAKQLTGLVSEPGAVATGFVPGTELKSIDGKNAGRITSATSSPRLKKDIALAYVRYDYLKEGTDLVAADRRVTVKKLPFLA